MIFFFFNAHIMDSYCSPLFHTKKNHHGNRWARLEFCTEKKLCI